MRLDLVSYGFKGEIEALKGTFKEPCILKYVTFLELSVTGVDILNH